MIKLRRGAAIERGNRGIEQGHRQPDGLGNSLVEDTRCRLLGYFCCFLLFCGEKGFLLGILFTILPFTHDGFLIKSI